MSCNVANKQVIHLLQYGVGTHSFSDVSRCNAGIIFRYSIQSCNVVY